MNYSANCRIIDVPAGRSELSFTPRPEKTFNRGATDYFVQGRKTDIGAFDSPKFAGVPIGTVRAIDERYFDVDLNLIDADDEEGSHETIHNGDGLGYYTADGILAGLRVNRAEDGRIFPAEPTVHLAGLAVGTTLYRTDQAFERLLEKKSAERHDPCAHDAASQ